MRVSRPYSFATLCAMHFCNCTQHIRSMPYMRDWLAISVTAKTYWTSAVHFVLHDDFTAMCQPDVGDAKRGEQGKVAQTSPCKRLAELQGRCSSQNFKQA